MTAIWQDILKPLLIPFARECLKDRPNTIFQQDGAPSHSHWYIQEVFSREGINQLFWPGNSPDLTPIEKAWPWMKKRTTFYGCPINDELRIAWRTEWQELSQESIQAWIEAIPRNIQEVIRLEGGNEYAEGRQFQRSYRGRRKVGELFKHAWIKGDEPIIGGPGDNEYEDVDDEGGEEGDGQASTEDEQE